MAEISFLELTSSRYLNAAILFAAAVIVAKLADLFVEKILLRLVSITHSDLDNRIITVIHRPVFLTVILFGASLALKTLEAPRGFHLLLKTLLIVLWSVTLLRLSAIIYGAFFEKIPRDSTAGQQFGPLLKNVTGVVLIVLGIMGVLAIWEVSITPLMASAGIAGVAVAFAAKDTIANFFGGISILIDRPYTVRNFIILDSGERGEVMDIGLRSTRIKTRDDVLITIPNSIMANAKIINESAPIKRFRIRIPVGVAYGSDIGKVEEVLLLVARQNSSVEEDPSPRVRFLAFGDSSLNFELQCWTDDPRDKGRVIHELNCAIYERFREHDITIPFPQRDLHLYRREEG